MSFALALFAAITLRNTFAAQAVTEPMWVTRLDQTSHQIVVHDARPGQPLYVYLNGRLFDVATPRSSVQTIDLRAPLAPGTLVTVVAAGSRNRAEIRSSATVQNDYLQYHYDLARTGWNTGETTLADANVGPATFGHLFSLPVDGFVLAQPLFVSGALIGNASHNVAIVATENDSVYAYDTDTGEELWGANYANPAAGALPIPWSVVKAEDIAPTIGITSTPAIDPDTNVIYFVAAIQQNLGDGNYAYHQYLHAVNLADGSDIPGSPVDITAAAVLSNGKLAPFDPLHQLNRESMLLADGLVYVGFGSHNDEPGGKPHGWLFAYDENTLNLSYFLNTSTDVTTRYYACIWEAGWAPAMDASGNIFLATGDGPFDGNVGGHNWGDTVLKLSPSLGIEDYFTPSDQNELLMQDHDLGGGGVMVLPDQPGLFPHLATVAGEEGTIYLVNRDAMGDYVSGGPDDVVQELPLDIGAVRGGPSYYSGPTGSYVYYCGSADPLRAYLLQTSPTTQLVRSSVATKNCGQGGTIPAVSSNGALPQTGIVWMTNRPNDKATSPVELFAYDATNVRRKLLEMPVGYWTNLHSQPFLVPTVIDGRVFVGMSSSVEEFGLLSSRSKPVRHAFWTRQQWRP